MKLRDWINKFPRKDRGKIRRQLAAHLEVSEVAIKKYASGERQLPVESLIPVHEFTNGEVAPIDERPDVGRVIDHFDGVAA